MKLSEREIDLINGMIEVQLNHVARCEFINNRIMGEKQKAFDMERVELLQKILKESDKRSTPSTVRKEFFSKVPIKFDRKGLCYEKV